MKKTLLMALILPCLANAATIELDNVKETASPFPYAKNGINIVPMERMGLPAEMKRQIILSKQSLAKIGYQNTIDTDANVVSLFNIPKIAKSEIQQWDNNSNLLDTHLRSTAAKIRLGFTFKAIPLAQTTNVIGYAAAGGYTKEKGWDGAVEFIEDPKLGICSYTTFKIEKVILDKETTQYEVNNKPSNKSVAGNWNTGFLYTLNWYEPDRLYILQCANKMFDTAILPALTLVANNIDKQ